VRRSRSQQENVCFGSEADIRAKGYVRFTPESGHVQCIRSCLLWPIAEIKPIANVDLFRHAQHLLRRVAMASNPQSRFQVRS
jgi:hypothetical protein